ncbi:MAG: hypothetical protein WA628_17055 [Terriglobales bacterium]
MAERKTRVRLTSLAVGCAIALLLTAALRKTHFGFWLPGAQPGWLVAWATRLVRPGAVTEDSAGLALVTAGNTAFYSWIFSRILRAEILARGCLSRHFLR